MSNTICVVCGFPVEQHTVELRFGVAHTVVRGADGRELYSCSQADGDRHYALGELNQALRIMRSLRWRAGRARTAGHWARCDVLGEYADKVEADRKRLLAYFKQWYSWKEQR